MKPNAVIFYAVFVGAALSGSATAFEWQIGDTRASLYGYAKLDVIHDVGANLGNTVKRADIRLDGEKGPEGHSILHGYQSRLGVSSQTVTEQGDVKVVLEGDFFGNGGGSFRLRHAYGEWNGITAGQTWTNFGGFLGMSPTIDFTPQPGQGNASRQAQLRYTQGGFSVALEDPNNLGGKMTVATSDSATQPLPDLTLRYQGRLGELSYGTSAVLRQLEYYQTANDEEQNAFGWGLNLEAAYLLTQGLVLRGSLTHGDGIGGYLEGSPAAPAYIDPRTGELESIKASGGTAGLSLTVGPGNMTLGYGVARADLDDAVNFGALTGGANKQFEAWHLNYIWSPITNVSYGLETSYHRRQVQDGREGDAVRLQGMVMYKF
ncbi:DcaP family trimeric outer membrane transporter [uncultured Oceanisphaera sp.]|uniref:DcaP family trimeric outer membrane transporter n=1 Tax=uncultured Oceanisphaera sp. TaxID=353858 RepID=UPI00262E4C4C|nr:DcaP family trimeric outer membrane transporter [uncultured Oceanisphaera sp.]